MTPICLWRRCSTDMDIVLASRNRKKIRELDGLLKSLCPDITVRSLDDIGFSGDIEENGQSFAENALIKASVPASFGYIGVADDSGLCVDALCGAPGIYSARYSGLGDTENNKKLLRELSGAEDRGAEFVCAVACVVPTSLGLCLRALRGIRRSVCYGRQMQRRDTDRGEGDGRFRLRSAVLVPRI